MTERTKNSGGSSRTNCLTNDVLFVLSCHVETVVLLSKREVESKNIRVEPYLEDMDISE